MSLNLTYELSFIWENQKNYPWEKYHEHDINELQKSIAMNQVRTIVVWNDNGCLWVNLL